MNFIRPVSTIIGAYFYSLDRYNGLTVHEMAYSYDGPLII